MEVLVLGHASSDDNCRDCWGLTGHKAAGVAAKDKYQEPPLSLGRLYDISPVSFGGSDLHGWKGLESHLQMHLRPFILLHVVLDHFCSFISG